MIITYNYRQPYPNELELYHHGIQGQKWGVRNGPPYPLSRQKTSTSKEGMSYKTQSSISKVVAGVGLVAGFASKMGLLPFPAGMAVSAISLGASAAMAVINHNREKKTAELAETEKKEAKENFELTEKTKQMTAEQDLKAVNPNWGEVGTTNNCVYCTAAYELRRRGYDATAEISGAGNERTKIEKWFPGSKVNVLPGCDGSKGTQTIFSNGESNLATVKHELSSYGDGARGYLGVAWGQQAGFGSNKSTFYTGGHATSWENVNGRTVIREAQSGKTYSSLEKYLDAQKRSGVVGAVTSYARLDNADVDTNSVSEAVRRK